MTSATGTQDRLRHMLAGPQRLPSATMPTFGNIDDLLFTILKYQAFKEKYKTNLSSGSNNGTGLGL